MLAPDQHAKSREFEVQQKVMVRNLRSGPKWIPGVIVQKLGPVLTYTVQVDGGKKHVDQIRRQGVGGEAFVHHVYKRYIPKLRKYTLPLVSWAKRFIQLLPIGNVLRKI